MKHGQWKNYFFQLIIKFSTLYVSPNINYRVHKPQPEEPILRQIWVFSRTTVSSRGLLNVTPRRSTESKNVSDYPVASTLYPENGGTVFPINDGTNLQDATSHNLDPTE
jgi:hypothetical protein